MLQSHGLRAGAGGGDYIPPAPGQYDPLIGGYFAGHMTYQPQIIGGGFGVSLGSIQVYQLWVEPKSSETSRLNSQSGIGPVTYGSLHANDQRNGFLNSSTGRRNSPIPDGQWYIPAHFELQQMFRYLAPTSPLFPEDGTTSTRDWYRNLAALPRWYPENGVSAFGIPADPFVTSNPDFQEGGSQALERGDRYVSSTIIDQTSIPVNANQIGKPLFNMFGGSITTPHYVQDYYNTGTSQYYLNYATYLYINGNIILNDTDVTLYTRRVQKRTINVSVEYIVDYYQTYDPVLYSTNTNDTIGRFRNKWNYENNFWNL